MHTSTSPFTSSAPASPPENVQTEVMSSTEIRVSWTEVPEIDRNGIITMYEVMYEPLMTFGVLTPATVNTTNLTIIVGGLEKYVNYSISVRAYTSEGPGPYSEDVTARTMEDGMDIFFNSSTYLCTSCYNVENLCMWSAMHHH